MELVVSGKSLIYLNKSVFTQLYKTYLYSYHRFNIILPGLNENTSSISGNYYGILAVHNIKTNSLDILLATQTAEKTTYRGNLLLTTLFHKSKHLKPDTINSYMTLKKMYPKLGAIRCVSFKGMSRGDI